MSSRRTPERFQCLRGTVDRGLSICLAGAFVLLSLTGCENGPPTFKELIGQDESEKPAAKTEPAPQQAQTPPKMTPKEVAPPAPKKRAPEDIISDYNSTKTKDRSDGLLAELAGMEDGQDQLTKIDVSQSGVTDAGIRHLENLDYVEEVNLSAVNFSTSGLSPLSKMKNLETLSLENTPTPVRTRTSNPELAYLDGNLAELNGAPKLRTLRLNRAKFSIKGMEEIAKMTDLEALYLAQTEVSDEMLAALTPLKNLRVLDLRDTRVTDYCFESLMAFENLEWLDVGGNKERITGQGFREARRQKGLDKLKHLAAFDTRWGDPGMEGIKNTKTLEYLDLGQTNVNDANLSAIKGLKDLKHIYLHRLDKVSFAGLKNISGHRDLETIYLDKTRRADDKLLGSFKRLKKLTRLVVTETACTEKGALALKKTLPDVKIYLRPNANPL